MGLVGMRTLLGVWEGDLEGASSRSKFSPFGVGLPFENQGLSHRQARVRGIDSLAVCLCVCVVGVLC